MTDNETYVETETLLGADTEENSDEPTNQFVDWSEEYDRLIQNPPREGDILKSGDDSPVILLIELKADSPPFVYGRAYVPEIVGAKLGWFLQSAESQGFHGWKCILMPRARTELIQRCGLKEEVIEIVSLKVIRHSVSGKSLLCEVHEHVAVEA